MIAYISPLLPKKTGIALYSQHLINALQTALNLNGQELVVFDDAVGDTNAYQTDYIAQEILPLTFEEGRRKQYRQFIYNFGNNPHYHLPVLQLLRQQPGIVVLHDTVLYYLIAGQGLGGVWQALLKTPNTQPIDSIHEIGNDNPEHDILRYSTPAKHPFLHEVLSRASSVVVHSKMAKEQVLKAGYTGPIQQVPLIDYQQAVGVDATLIENSTVIELVKQKESQGTFVIGLFGFSGETKRSHSIFIALSGLAESLKSRVKLLIIGNDHYQADIKATGITDLVVNSGYVNDADYDQSMALCDLIINLRYPSMGETSAVQIQAMSAEKPSIVSNYGWFSELADDTVHKITADEQEVEQLQAAISRMMTDEPYRLSMAQAAKHYVKQHHSPTQVAQQWMDIIAESRDPIESR